MKGVFLFGRNDVRWRGIKVTAITHLQGDPIMNRADLIKKFDKQARWYEKRRIQQAQKEWRQKLLYFARGNVLEVAVGAGANFSFYPPGVRITAVDFSPEMLKRARNAADEYGIEVEFKSDVETLTFPPDSFDTVVSTLSLCGYEDPVGVLNRFSRWSRKDGCILLWSMVSVPTRFFPSCKKLWIRWPTAWWDVIRTGI
jgi:ubiquinone/menaquinone biosynthesis C-methylase UbiE